MFMRIGSNVSSQVVVSSLAPELWYDATDVGAQGYSLDFDGTDDYAQADNEITAYPFTLETWVKFDVIGVSQSILFLSNSTTSNIYYGFGLTTTGKLTIRNRNTTDTLTVGNTIISENTWIHVACVFTSDTSKTLYLNGVSEITQTNSVSFSSSDIVVLMGLLRTTSPITYLNGKLSDVRVWNTARTVTEILDNYNKRLIGNETGLVGYWKLDEGNSTTAKDYTSNENAGTINGAIWDNGEPFSSEVISDFTGIRTWKDKSGNGYDAEQITSASRPTYRTNQVNGKPALVFDGADDILSLSGGALGILRNVAGATIFAVVKYANTLALKGVIFISNNSTFTRMSLQTDLSNKLTVIGRRLDADSFQMITSTNTASTSFILQTGLADFQNTILRQYINGTLDGEKLDFQTSGNTSDTNSGSISIGTGGGSLNGAIAEIIVFNRTLSTSELTNVNIYLIAKWGL